MNRFKCILWLIGGPISSLVIAWFVLMFIYFGIGGGTDMDNLNPPWQHTVLKLSFPAAGIAFVAGTLFSIYMAIAILRKPDQH